jgi:hypothetical protein
MQVFTTEVIFQPNPNLDFTDPGSLHQTYSFSRETVNGIYDAYESVFRSLRPRLSLTLLDLPQPGLEMLTPFSGLLDCNPEGVFDLSRRKRYVLYMQNCAYTFDSLDYLSGFFYVFTLFQKSPRPLNLKLYDFDQRNYVQIPYPEGM